MNKARRNPLRSGRGQGVFLLPLTSPFPDGAHFSTDPGPVWVRLRLDISPDDVQGRAAAGDDAVAGGTRSCLPRGRAGPPATPADAGAGRRPPSGCRPPSRARAGAGTRSRGERMCRKRRGREPRDAPEAPYFSAGRVHWCRSYLRCAAGAACRGHLTLDVLRKNITDSGWDSGRKTGART